MTELQSKLVEMLGWFHEFCNENGITYYAIAGTALGAVRHGGFIPWDDDIDIGLPRKEYNKLIQLLENKDLGNYVIEKPLDNKDYVYHFSKLYNKRTILIENTRYKAKRGIYIDIFPLDGVGNNYIESKKYVKKIGRKLDWISCKTCAINGRRKWYKNLAILLSRSIPELIFGWKRTIKKVTLICEKNSFDDKKYVSNLEGKKIIPKEYFGQPKIMKFENIYVNVPTNVEGYLELMYGDYMKLPSKENQKSLHDYLFLDLTKSYID